MTDRSCFAEGGLPEDLRHLDAELASIRYEERPSFAPELEAELERAWKDVRPHGRPALRFLAAAALAALLVGAAAVPAARASFVQLMGVLRSPPHETVRPPAEPGRNLPAVADATSAVADSDTVAPAPVSDEPEPRAEYGGPDDFAGVTPPRMIDRLRAEDLLRATYPQDLQESGVGGTVWLRLWVDAVGGVDYVTVDEGSGEPALDRAALRVGRSLRFEPGTRGGETVGTWVEFPVVFEPEPPAADAHDGSVVATGGHDALDAWASGDAGAPLDLSGIAEWRGDAGPGRSAAEDLSAALVSALSGTDVIETLGPIHAILSGDPPRGTAPTQWRTSVSAALEAAMLSHPDNPAPALALSRIRLEQGLRTEARVLIEEGLRAAIRAEGSVPSALVAELHYERGVLMEESWLASRASGRVRADAFAGRSCPTARSSGDAVTGFASVERLIAWNYSCPTELQAVFEAGFEEADELRGADLALMAASFRAAVEANPAHVGANVKILVALADQARWAEALGAARRFVRASGGHPYGLLYAGLALQRLRHPEEARERVELGLRGLPDAEADQIRDISALLAPHERSEYALLSGDERRRSETHFWAAMDPIRSTTVNEREVEHLVRSVHARLRFGPQGSDAREVWVRYGRPDRIRSIAEGMIRRTEFWDYGNGPDVTFARLGQTDRMDLTPEGRAYVDDLRDVFPHRYGPWSRTLLTLPVQMSRFAAAGQGRSEIEVHTEVPTSFATGAADTLEVTLFLLDAAGAAVERVGETIGAEPGPVSLRAPLPAEAATVVVEVLDRETGRVAGAREAARPAVPHAPALSDLLLLRPEAPPAGPLTPRVRWMTPYTSTARLEADVLHVFFEVYGVGPGEYRLWSEVVDRDTRDVLRVPLSPVGERGFDTAWTRSAERDGARAELVRVDLGAVPSGRYALRMFVESAADGSVEVAERDIGRR